MAGRSRRNADGVLLIALASGKTYAEAAQAAGVSVATVKRRLQEPEFRQQIADIRAEMLERTMAALTANGVAAVSTLVQLLEADSEGARLAAAKHLLEIGTKLRDHYNHEARIAALEAAARKKEANGSRDYR